MFRRTPSPQPALALWAARALGWVPVPPKTPYLSQEWCSERDTRNPRWRTVFNELAPEQTELPEDPDAQQPLSGFTIAASDDLDVKGFLSTYGVEPTMVHRRPETDHPFIDWMKSEGAFVVGKLKNSTCFARTDCSTLCDHPAAIAVTTRCCDVALCGSILGPAVVSSPATADVFAFKPSVAALPDYDPPFSKRYSLGFVTRHVGVAEKLWQEMVGRPQRNRSVNLLSQFEDDDEATISRPIPDYMKLSSKDRPSPTIKLGVPVEWINEVLGKQGCGEALAEGLQSKVKAKVREGRHTTRAGRISSRVGAWIAAKASAAQAQAYQQMKNKMKEEKETGKKPAKETMIDIEVQSVKLNWDVRAVLDVATTIVNYELARSLQGKHSLSSSGLLDQLPKQAVNAIYSGKEVTDRQYDAALAEINIIKQDIVDEMRNTDCLCLPLLSPPFQNQNLRSIAFTLPFSLMGCSCAGFRLPLGQVSGDSTKYSEIRKVGVVHNNRSFSGMGNSGDDDEKAGLRLVPNDYDGGLKMAAEKLKKQEREMKKKKMINLAAAKHQSQKTAAAATASEKEKEKEKENADSDKNSTATSSDSSSSSSSNETNQQEQQQKEVPATTSTTTTESSKTSSSSSSSSPTSTAAAQLSTTTVPDDEYEFYTEKKYSINSPDISLPIILVAEPGQDTIIFEAARSLLNRVD